MQTKIGILAFLAMGCTPYGKECADHDGDGVFAGCLKFDEKFPGPDCNDDADDVIAADNWNSCDECIDGDGDGAYSGCDQYVSLNGPDCSDLPHDPFSIANQSSCETCVDEDGDGAFVGCDAYENGFREDSNDARFSLLIVVSEELVDDLQEALGVYRGDLLQRIAEDSGDKRPRQSI